MESLNDILWNEEYMQEKSANEVIHAEIDIICITYSCGHQYWYCGNPTTYESCTSKNE